MKSRYLDLGTCVCSLSASEEIHAAMRHYVSPFLVPIGEREPSLTISIDHDAVAVTKGRQELAQQSPATVRSSHPEQRYHVWFTEDREILIPRDGPDHMIIRSPGFVYVVAESVRSAATIGTRVVRQLLMRGGEASGGRCVHAAAVDMDGSGVLIAGHPGAGKTTVLTHLIEDHGARPVSNDRTVLIPTETGRWNAIGVPLAVRYTPEGISGSRTLAAALDHFEPSRGRCLVEGKIELTPWEISYLFNRPAVPMTEVTRLVILARSSQAPTAARAGSFVRRHLDFGAEDFFADDWLNLGYHLSGLLTSPRVRNDDFWGCLAEAAPVVPMTWSDPAELPRIATAVYTQARQ